MVLGVDRASANDSRVPNGAMRTRDRITRDETAERDSSRLRLLFVLMVVSGVAGLYAMFDTRERPWPWPFAFGWFTVFTVQLAGELRRRVAQKRAAPAGGTRPRAT